MVIKNNYFKRIAAFVIALLLFWGDLPFESMQVYAEEETWGKYVAAEYAGGDGSENDPYKIATAEQLAYFSKSSQTNVFSNTYFQLTDNIDLSAHEWIPVWEFRGTFDGNGKTVSGLKIGTAELPATMTGQRVGLFALVKGSVKNLTVNAEIYVSDTESGNYGIGGIVGHLTGTLNNCQVKGVVSGVRALAQVGGLVGYAASGCTIINCVNEASISAGSTSTHVRVGGIAGCTEIGSSHTGNSVIANCANKGAIKATAGAHYKIAGIAGLAANNSTIGKTLSIYNCYNTGTLTGTGATGSSKSSNIAYSDTASEVTTNYLYGTATVTHERFSPDTTAISEDSFADTLTNNAKALTEAGLVTGLMHWQKVEGDTPILAAPPEPVNVSLNVNVSSDAAFGSVEVTHDTAPITSFPANLEKDSKVSIAFKPVTGYELKTFTVNNSPIENHENPYELTVSADMVVMVEFASIATIPEKWTDAGAVAEAFAGGTGEENNPYLISTPGQLAYLAKTEQADGTVYRGKYFELTDNIDLSDYEWVPVARFEGFFNGNGKSITGLRIGTEANPAQTNNAGLFGMVIGGAVKNLTVDTAIYLSDTKEGNNGVAGIAGYLRGTLDRCTVKGTINGTRGHAFVGGLAGYAGYGSVIKNCSNEATVTGGTIGNVARIGGIAGYTVLGSSHAGDVLIANCYNKGTVIAASGSKPNAAGISGVVQNSSTIGKTIAIYNCYNAGEVQAGAAATGAQLGNISAYTIGTAPKTASLYGKMGMTNDAVSCDTTIDMTTDAFAEDLTIYADALVGAGICSDLLGWTAKAGATAVHGTSYVTGELAIVNVTATPSRMGTVTIKADETGGTNYTEFTKKAMKKGSKVQLTIVPVSGCKFTELALNDQTQEVTGNTFEFTVSEATEVKITFEVESTVVVDAIYVNSNAQGNGDGTESNPFRTLQEAQTKLREVLATAPNADVTVYLMDGTHRLEETMKLTEEDTSFGRVTFKNYDDANPVITSGHITGKFTKVSGKEYYSYQLPETDKVNGSWPQSRDLYVDGERATIARTEDLIYKNSYDNEVFKPNSTSIKSCDNSLYVSKEALDGVADSEITNVEIGQLVEWKSQIFHIASRNVANVKDGEVNISINAAQWDDFIKYDWNIKSLKGRSYWLQNHLNFLDEPGEFYYDSTNGIIYYYPYTDQNMDTAVIEYGTLDKLVELDHASNITFDGIEFTGTTANWITENGLAAQQGGSQYGYKVYDGWGDCGEHVPCAAIYGDYAEGIKIFNCKFEELGGSAVVFQYGTKDLEIVGNVMKDLAMAGVQVGVAQLKWNQDGIPGNSENVTINNNYITNVGLLVYSVPAIGVKRCENLTINYNKIVHVPYAGITAGWGFSTSTEAEANKNLVNAEIAYNYVEDYIYKINDGGAIYTNGANAAVDDATLTNEIHHNYVRAGAHNATYTGIYHDGSASNWLTYDNFVDDVRSRKGPVFFQDDVSTQFTHHITAKDNYTTTSLITQNGATDAAGNARNIVLENNIMFANRSKINEAAKAIMEGAGLQAAYRHLEIPMDVELRIADDTMHYEVNKKQAETTKMQIELTNHSSSEKTYTISVTSSLPAGIALTINGGSGVTVAAGETKIVTAEFVITDGDKVIDTEDYVAGLLVEDTTGRKVIYPRTFTVKTLSGNVAGEIPYGTPTIDGVLDEAYKEGTMNFFGKVFHPDTYHETDIAGGYYLLWDENYLYCYVIVNESTIMSRGTEWIQAQIDAGKQGSLWESDAVETYLKVPSIRTGDTKFAIDAFGIQRFGQNNISLDIHNELPYATKFTYNGEIIHKELPKNIAAGQTASAALGTQVSGYVIEMTLPIKQVETILTSEDGVPSAGDILDFYVQNNDYRGTKDDGSAYMVAQKNEISKYTLKAKPEKPTEEPIEEPIEEPTEPESKNDPIEIERSKDTPNIQTDLPKQGVLTAEAIEVIETEKNHPESQTNLSAQGANTGDSSQMELWMTIVIAATVIMTATIYFQKKKNR